MCDFTMRDAAIHQDLGSTCPCLLHNLSLRRVQSHNTIYVSNYIQLLENVYIQHYVAICAKSQHYIYPTTRMPIPLSQKNQGYFYNIILPSDKCRHLFMFACKLFLQRVQSHIHTVLTSGEYILQFAQIYCVH